MERGGLPHRGGGGRSELKAERSRSLAPPSGTSDRRGGTGVSIRGSRVGVGRTAEVLAWDGDRVLKLFYEGFPREIAEEEAHATGALYEVGLPVPRVDGVIEEAGRPGIVFERVDGPSMLSRVTRFPWPVTRLARVLADLHESVHRHRMPELPSLRDALSRRIHDAPGLGPEERQAVHNALVDLPRTPSSVTATSTRTTSSCPPEVPSSSTGPMSIRVTRPRTWPRRFSSSAWASRLRGHAHDGSSTGCGAGSFVSI